MKISGDEFQKCFKTLAERESFVYAIDSYYTNTGISFHQLGEEQYIIINSHVEPNTYIYFAVDRDAENYRYFPYICVEKGNKVIPIIFFDENRVVHEVSKDGEVT